MAKKVIVARFTHTDGQEYIGKREVKPYDTKDSDNIQLIADANVGLTLRTQRQIRDALKEKHGIKSVSTKGEAKDLSAIEEV